MSEYKHDPLAGKSEAFKEANKNYRFGSPGGPVGKRFEKGKSGNPSGKRKNGLSSAELLKLGESRLSALIETELAKEDGKNAYALAKALVQRAIEGDEFSVKAVLDRVDGPIEKKLNISGMVQQQVISLVEAPRPTEFQLVMEQSGVVLPLPEAVPTPAEVLEELAEEE
jgi:hypothetical protein